MSEFISRKQLEVTGNTYPHKDRLKHLGCEWDPAARAWIAPSLEVKELCDEIVEGGLRPPSQIGHNWGKFDDYDFSFLDDLGSDSDSAPMPRAASIAYTPTQTDAEKICGGGNVIRYWREEIPAEAAEILANGDVNWQAIYSRLEDAGWRSRSVSILKDVVEHFRKHPPIPAIDEMLTAPSVLSHEAVEPEEINGTISVFVDADQNPVSFKIQFPYSKKMVARVKGFSGRKWRADSKCWEVPLDAKGWGFPTPTIFQAFPHFKRSPKAEQIEREMESDI